MVLSWNEIKDRALVFFRPQHYTKAANRIEFLFELYEKYTAGLFARKG